MLTRIKHCAHRSVNDQQQNPLNYSKGKPHSERALYNFSKFRENMKYIFLIHRTCIHTRSDWGGQNDPRHYKCAYKN